MGLLRILSYLYCEYRDKEEKLICELASAWTEV